MDDPQRHGHKGEEYGRTVESLGQRGREHRIHRPCERARKCQQIRQWIRRDMPCGERPVQAAVAADRQYHAGGGDDSARQYAEHRAATRMAGRLACAAVCAALDRVILSLRVAGRCGFPSYPLVPRRTLLAARHECRRQQHHHCRPQVVHQTDLHRRGRRRRQPDRQGNRRLIEHEQQAADDQIRSRILAQRCRPAKNQQQHRAAGVYQRRSQRRAERIGDHANQPGHQTPQQNRHQTNHGSLHGWAGAPAGLASHIATRIDHICTLLFAAGSRLFTPVCPPAPTRMTASGD